MVENQHIKGNDQIELVKTTDEFEACTFSECNFSESDFSDKTFLDCTFTSCDLSLAKLDHTALKNVTFIECKLLGLHFENCNPFLLELHFNACMLDHASFYSTVLTHSTFENCKMHEVEFTDADLRKSKITNCDLLNARFERVQAEKTNFSGSYNVDIDPVINNITNATFSHEALPGLLHRYGLKIVR